MMTGAAAARFNTEDSGLVLSIVKHKDKINIGP